MLGSYTSGHSLHVRVTQTLRLINNTPSLSRMTVQNYSFPIILANNIQITTLLNTLLAAVVHKCNVFYVF